MRLFNPVYLYPCPSLFLEVIGELARCRNGGA
jgi:hypothetical protein